MVNCCDICGSLMFRGKCTNPNCGKPTRVPWAKENPKLYMDAIANGKSRLITATRGVRAADLGGPPIGMMAKGRSSSDGSRKERTVPEKVCTMTQLAAPGADGFSSWECSRCLDKWDWPDESIGLLHYCPNCGSRIIASERHALAMNRREGGRENG